ncbi:hypothetical protein C8J57DRAFT_1538836 [Mycena rebaudengoi]|nr:hypothetical protein C8J57DRAFT_1538836 [Mycena rebaudengoi]
MAEEINFNATIGPEEVGVIVGAWMFGMFTVQAFNYFSDFPHDSKRLKVIVSLIPLILQPNLFILSRRSLSYVNRFLELAHHLSVREYRKVFFAHRVLILSGSWIIPIICWFLSFLRMLSLVAVCAATITTPFIPEFKAKWDWLVLASIGISTTVDVVVAVALCVLLWQRRNRSGVQSTRQTIDSLMAWTINTGLITSAASIMMLIFFVTMANFAWLTMLLIIPRLFANSMLASLNSRSKHRDGKSHLVVDADTVNSSSRANHNRKFETSIAIEMSRIREVATDDLPPSDEKVCMCLFLDLGIA